MLRRISTYLISREVNTLLKEVFKITAKAIVAGTAIVATKNALQVKSDEEVGHEQSFYEKYLKRPQDFFCASCAAVVLSPVLAGTALLVKYDCGTPIIFSQERPGRNGELFRLYKFRTMTDERDENGELLPDEQRLTKIGKFLRSTSIDELPELFNMIKGDMSIVGPRPLLAKYKDLYNEHQARRHEVRPGFTGLAQVNGRNSISWKEKFDMDVEYIKNINFKDDWKIIFKTLKTVIKREGIHSGTSATMEEFTGNGGNDE